MENEEFIPKKLFTSKNIIIGISTIIFLPLMIGCIISFGKWLSFIDGNSSVWIGFWGSYLGGILGTIGVLFVAQLQNKEQRVFLEITEKNNKKRLKTQILIELADNYNKDLNEFHSKLTNIQNKINQINKLAIEAIGTTKNRGIDAINRDIYKNINYLKNMDIPANFVVITFGNLKFQNITLSSQGFTLEKPLQGEQSFYYDEILEFLTSSDYSNSEFLNLLNKINKDKNKNFKDILEWTLSEKVKLTVASAYLLNHLE